MSFTASDRSEGFYPWPASDEHLDYVLTGITESDFVWKMYSLPLTQQLVVAEGNLSIEHSALGEIIGVASVSLFDEEWLISNEALTQALKALFDHYAKFHSDQSALLEDLWAQVQRLLRGQYVPTTLNLSGVVANYPVSSPFIRWPQDVSWPKVKVDALGIFLENLTPNQFFISVYGFVLTGRMEHNKIVFDRSQAQRLGDEITIQIGSFMTTCSVQVFLDELSFVAHWYQRISPDGQNVVADLLGRLRKSFGIIE